MEEGDAIRYSILLAVGVFVLFVIVFSINVLKIGDEPFRSKLSIFAMVVFTSITIVGIAILLRSTLSPYSIQ